MRIALLAGITLALTTAASAQSLSGEQIRTTLIGNTFSGFADGETYSEHLNADGTISGHSPSDAYAGRWRISGDQICFSCPEGKREAKWDCTEVKLRGSRIIWDDNATAKLGEGGR